MRCNAIDIQVREEWRRGDFRDGVGGVANRGLCRRYEGDDVDIMVEVEVAGSPGRRINGDII